MDKVESFKQRIGYSRLEAMAGVDGVVADWTEVAALVTGSLRERRGINSTSYVVEPGLAHQGWTWSTRDRELNVSVFVSGRGYAAVHEQFILETTDTTTLEVRLLPGPAGLGDLAAHFRSARSSVVTWVFRNVLVYINDADGEDVEPIARAIQRFMEGHLAARVAEHLPRVDRVETSARQLRVGDEWRIAVGLATASAEALRFGVEEESELLALVNCDGSTATFRALAAGEARVAIQIFDRRTLLSPPLWATVEVLPGP